MWGADARLSALLGAPVELAWATVAVAPAGLTVGERTQFRALGPGAGRHDWLLGRAALKALLPDGLRDTTGLAFPHPFVSLSHAGGTAVAARADGCQRGTGVDFEPWRPEVDRRMARYFLRPAEQAAVTDERALLRLWTIKESLYKATPDNRGRLLLDFELIDPAAAAGDAVGPGGEKLRYAAIDVAPGHLAVALSQPYARR